MSFKTLESETQAVITEKKSAFICSLKYVETEEEAIEFVRRIREANREARHNPYAYTVGFPNETRRHSDDGEPSGTAGMPILEVLVKNELKNTAAVVTRYFGGILLGAAGLARAYAASVVAAVESARIIRMVLCTTLTIIVEYRFKDRIITMAESMGCLIGDVDYGLDCTIEIFVPNDILCEIESGIRDITSSNGIMERGRRDFRPLPVSEQLEQN